MNDSPYRGPVHGRNGNEGSQVRGLPSPRDLVDVPIAQEHVPLLAHILTRYGVATDDAGRYQGATLRPDRTLPGHVALLVARDLVPDVRRTLQKLSDVPAPDEHLLLPDEHPAYFTEQQRAYAAIAQTASGPLAACIGKS